MVDKPQAYFVSISEHCEFLETWDYQIQNKIFNVFFCVELLHHGDKNKMGMPCHKFLVFLKGKINFERGN
jgi:hypothetical protein